MTNIIVLDTETGGFNYETDGLVSVAMKVFNEDKKLYIVLQKNEGLLYNEKAMAINNMTEGEMRNGLTEHEAVQAIISFVQQNYVTKPCPLGQNVMFDINFLKELFKRNGESFDTYFSHCSRDTKTSALLLQDSGLLRENCRINLGNLFVEFTGKRPDNAHHAMADVLMTEELYNKIITMLNKKNNNIPQ
jgi:DNA polymerase III epsilon subunit-like protein